MSVAPKVLSIPSKRLLKLSAKAPNAILRAFGEPSGDLKPTLLTSVLFFLVKAQVGVSKILTSEQHNLLLITIAILKRAMVNGISALILRQRCKEIIVSIAIGSVCHDYLLV
jgi:hypothetical protein